MSLSYYFTFTAPATATADELTAFLKQVEKEAQRIGFKPTVVLMYRSTRRNGGNLRGTSRRGLRSRMSD
jgi:hypothetical protein